MVGRFIKRIDFFGLPLDTSADIKTICGFLGEKNKSRLINFIRPESWALAKEMPDYIGFLDRMTLNLPDGHGLALICRWLMQRPCERLRFEMASLADPFFTAAVAQGSSVMLIGGRPGMDESVHSKLHAQYPGLNIVGAEHGFGEIADKVQAVIAQAPDVVIAGMGSPRQERFLLALKAAGYKGIAIASGSFFEQYLEAQPYYPAWVVRWRLHSLYRLRRDFGRLWMRYGVGYPMIAMQVAKVSAAKARPAVLKRS